MQRNDFHLKIITLFNTSNIVAILGPRQCGKTMLAHQFADKQKNWSVNYFDVEDPRDINQLYPKHLEIRILAFAVIPAKAGIQIFLYIFWIPTFAGMTSYFASSRETGIDQLLVIYPGKKPIVYQIRLKLSVYKNILLTIN